MTPTADRLTWHQMHAARRRHALRNHSAHIQAADYIATGRALCGRKNPRVIIDPEHRNNPNNRPCAQCAAAADKLNLPAALSPMKFTIYIHGRRHSAGPIPADLETLAAPEGATLRTHDGTRPRWYWRTLDRWTDYSPHHFCDTCKKPLSEISGPRCAPCIDQTLRMPRP